MSNVWQCLEVLAEGNHVAAAWAKWSGEHFAPLHAAFLQDTQQQARWMVCPHGCGCEHEIFAHEPEQLVAVCRCEPRSCDDLTITAISTKLLRLNSPKFGREVARVLDCTPQETDLGVAGAKQIATFGNGVLPIVLLIRPDTESLTNAVAQLVARLPERFILLIPTRRLLNGQALSWLKTAKAACFDLESHLVLLPSGKLQARKRGGELFSPSLPTASQPTDEDQARQLFALIEKMESDRRLKNPSVMEVFRLYCIKGKTTDQMVDICKASKGTIINRLQVIQKVTGKDPKELQAFSPYLQRIEESITDSRAEHIHRKTLVHDTSETEDE